MFKPVNPIHHSNFKNKIHDSDFISGRIDRAKKYAGMNISSQDIDDELKNAAEKVENGTASKTEMLLYITEMSGKNSRACIGEKNQIKTIKKILKSYSKYNIEHDKLPNRNGIYFNNGSQDEINYYNGTKSMDYFLTYNNKLIYFALKNNNKSGGVQDFSRNEIRLLINHSPSLTSSPA